MKNLFFLIVVSTVLFTNCKESPNTPSQEQPAEDYYKELFRPQFHFTPEANWMNDPNGMVYHEGEYHLFYQYYPDSTVWGPMHWGHAVSTDLVKWEHLPIALYPDDLGYIFSGSCIIDKGNTSGLGTPGTDPMIAIFTHHDPVGAAAKTNTFQYQSIAYSNDNGRTFTKYEGNPVIENPGIVDFRDPKVIWDLEREQWVMIFAANDHAKIYGSKNLIDWTHLSDWGKEYGAHGGLWECPDLFPLTLPESGEQKWVLLQSLNPGGPNGGSGTQYFIGDFDGTKFTLDPAFEGRVKNGNAVWLDFGKDNYAGVTWSNTPDPDKKYFIGWMSNWDYAQKTPTSKWRSAMTLPRELSLYKNRFGYHLRTKPVAALSTLEGEKKTFTGQVFSRKTNLVELGSGQYKLHFVLPRPTEKPVVFKFSNSKDELIYLGYDPIDHKFFLDRSKSGVIQFSKEYPLLTLADIEIVRDKIEMLIYIDHSSVELFADDGEVIVTELCFPSEPFDQVDLIYGNSITAEYGTIVELDGIWD